MEGSSPEDLSVGPSVINRSRTIHMEGSRTIHMEGRSPESAVRSPEDSYP